MTRKSLRTGRLAPTGRISPYSNTRSSFTWIESGMSATSSKNSVPPSACSSKSLARLLRAGERAASVPEQLALGQRRAERRHVDRHERPVGPMAVLVDRPGDQLLARAAFAADMDARLGRRDDRDPLENLLNRRRRADHPRRLLGRNGLGRRRAERPAIFNARSIARWATFRSNGFTRYSKAPLRTASTAVARSP